MAHVFGDLRAKVFAGVKVAHVPFIISHAGAPGEGLRSFGITRIIGRDCYPHVAKGKADRFTNAPRAARYHCSYGPGNSSTPNARSWPLLAPPQAGQFAAQGPAVTPDRPPLPV